MCENKAVVLPDGKGSVNRDLWLEPATAHGHFHAGEEVLVNIYRGYNMKPFSESSVLGIEAFCLCNQNLSSIAIIEHNHEMAINLGEVPEGLMQLYVQELTEATHYYGKIVLEIGHHHHQALEPLGLPLELTPADNNHARMGAQYEVQVLKNGQPVSGAEVRITYANTSNPDYPHKLTSNAQGRIQVFMSAPGNYLFSVFAKNVISTLTVVKSF